MADHSKQGHAEEAGHSHGITRYVVIWLVLLFFTFLTVFTGRIDLGAANIYVAMLIATTKATLVVLFFMHLYDEGAVNRLIFVSSLLFALVLMLGVFGDLMTRQPGGLPNGGPLPSKLHGGHVTVPSSHGHGSSHSESGAANPAAAPQKPGGSGH